MIFTWRAVPIAELITAITVATAGADPAVIAVDGYSSGGKTTVAERLAALTPRAAVLHTDDIAWYHSIFDWDDVLIEGILTPFRRGEPVSFRPPPWDERGRPGAIDIPAGARTLFVEGVGSGRQSLSDQLDAHVWVETLLAIRVNRNSVRVARGEMSFGSYQSWDLEERLHMHRDHPWERADVVVAGEPRIPYDVEAEILLGSPVGENRATRRG